MDLKTGSSSFILHPSSFKSWLPILLLVGLLGFVSVADAQQTAPDPEPAMRAVLDRFLAAFAKEDMAAALACVTTTPDERAWMRNYLQGDFDANASQTFRIEKHWVRQVAEPLALSRAQLRWNWTPNGKPEVTGGLHHWDFAWEFQDGGWKLRAFQLVEVELLRKIKITPEPAERKKLLERQAEVVKGWLPLALREQANELSEQGKQQDAEQLYVISFEVAEWMNDDYERAYCYLSRGSSRRRALKWNPALSDWEQARVYFEKKDDKEGLAKVWRNAGDVYHHLGKFEKAVSAYEDSIRYWHEIKDEKGEAGAVQDLGTVYQDFGRPAEAGKYYEQALEMHTRLGNRKGVAQLIGNLASVRHDEGRYPEALALYEKAAVAAREVNDPGGESAVLTNLGNLHDLLAENVEGERYHRLAVAAAERSSDRRDLMIALHNLFNSLTRQNRSDEAIEVGMRGMKIADELDDRRFQAQTFNTLGELYYREKLWKGALMAYEDAVSSSRSSSNRVQESVALMGLAATYFRSGNIGRALVYFDQARPVVAECGNQAVQMDATRLEANLYFEIGDYPRAVRLLRKTIDLVEQIRAQTGLRSLQTSYLRAYASLYHNLAECLFRLGDARGAFAVSEQIRARGLTDIIRAGSFRITKAMTSEEQTAESSLETQLQSVSRSLEKAVLSDEVERLKVQQGEARKELQKFQDGLYVRRPQLRAQRADFAPATPEELALRVLGKSPHTALLSYFALPKRTLLFVLRADAGGKPRLTMHNIPVPGNTLIRRGGEFWQVCSTPGGAFEAPAKALYQDLIQPALPELAGVRHLIVITGQELAALPFAALLDPKGKALVAHYSLSYAPSATALMYMLEVAPQRTEAGSLPLLAFGNPVFPPNLSELPATQGEVTGISRLFGPKARTFTRAEARESRAKALLSQARIVHFATHGSLDERAPMYSAVVLTRDDRDDGLLQGRELAELELHADLVVLSACETALGERVNGEGVVGLTWALFVGGARSTVTSQWQVADESTGTLMTQFYRRLARPGVERAEAMREAQLKLLRDKRYAHPYHWAPFALNGSWTAIETIGVPR